MEPLRVLSVSLLVRLLSTFPEGEEMFGWGIFGRIDVYDYIMSFAVDLVVFIVRRTK